MGVDFKKRIKALRFFLLTCIAGLLFPAPVYSVSIEEQPSSTFANYQAVEQTVELSDLADTLEADKKMNQKSSQKQLVFGLVIS